jgi:hypothetical protein
MRSVLDMEAETAQQVKNTATAARVLSYIKDNRTEMIALAILVHLLGLSDRVLGQLNGVCL